MGQGKTAPIDGQTPIGGVAQQDQTWWHRHGAFVVLLGIAVLAWTSFLGRVPLFDWDELNFAEVSREMLVLNDWSRVHINYELFWEKPPLFFWLQASSMSLFGVSAFAARFPNALIGLINLLLLYCLGQRLEDRRLGFFWALAWFGSLLPHLYAKSGLIDPLFNLCMLLGLYAVMEGAWQLEGRFKGASVRVQPSARNAGLAFGAAGIALGLAVLAKGPVGVLLPGLAVLGCLLLPQGAPYRRMPRFWLGLLLTGLLAVGTAGSWFLYDWSRNGAWFTESFLAYQWRLLLTEDAGHGGFPGYHPIVLLLGCFPSSLLALRAMPWAFGRQKAGAMASAGSRRLQAWGLAMVILLAVVLLVFGFVQSKIVHYSSLAYYPIAFLAAVVLWQWDGAGQASRHAKTKGAGRARALSPVRKRLGLGLGQGLGSGHHGGLRLGIFAPIGAIAGLWSFALLLAFLASHFPERVARRISDPAALAQWHLIDPLPWWTLIPVLALPIMAALAIRSLKLGFTRTGALWLFAGGAFFLQCSLWAVARPAEQLAQGPVVQWWSSLAGQDVYRYAAYRSYAPFFYGQPPVPSKEVLDQAAERALHGSAEAVLGKHGFYRRPETQRVWLFWSDELDKPVWIVAKAGEQADYIAGITGMERMDAQGAYVLLRRMPKVDLATP